MAAKALLVALVLLTVTLPAAAARRQDQETIEVSISRGCPAALYALYGVRPNHGHGPMIVWVPRPSCAPDLCASGGHGALCPWRKPGVPLPRSGKL